MRWAAGCLHMLLPKFHIGLTRVSTLCLTHMMDVLNCVWVAERLQHQEGLYSNAQFVCAQT